MMVGLTRASRRIRAAIVAATLVVSGLSVIALSANVAVADTQPAAGTPVTTTADALPTVQQNGVVWAEVTVGNTVYATGSFSQTYPANAAKTAANATARGNLLAFDIRTGNLITGFNHTLNAQGLAITASPDGSRVYVAGDFTTVDGVTHNHIVAFDTATGNVATAFAASISNKVNAVVATNSTVYAGGNFFSANGVTRTRLAAFQSSNGGLLAWAPKADDNFVSALVLTPDQSRVVIGGRFATINSVPTYGLGLVDATGGTTVYPFAMNQVVQDYGSKCGILSLSTDGVNVYGSGFAFGCGNFEGTFAANPMTGAVVWVSDCHGDTYGTFSTGQVLYSVSHAHECSEIGEFPDTNPRVWHHALAETVAPLTTNIGPDSYGWNYNGVPAPGLLHWYPDLGIGSVTGQAQAAWSVTGNSQYIALGGEFPSVNGNGNQTGLVRFAVPGVAPDKNAPNASTTLTPKAISFTSGTARVAWQATWDRDNANLTYNVYRDGGTTPVFTATQASVFWKLPAMGFIDRGLVPGSKHTYQVKVTDPDNNTTSSATSSVTISASNPSTYVTDVQGDGASDFWRFDEAAGNPSVYDWTGFSDLATGTGLTRGVAGATNDSDAATSFDGTANGGAATQSAITGPNTFTLETWINTTTTSGGKIIGFGDQPVGGTSGSYDRHVYMDNAGHIIFGVYNNGVNTVSSNGTYNDGQYHQIVASLSGAGMVLYIDGKKVGSNQGTTSGQPYSGYWRIGGDNLGGWPSQPASNNFAGTIDDTAIYPTALSLTQVQKHYLDSGRTLNIPPAPTDRYGKAVYADSPDLYWRLDENGGPTAKDASPNGDDGIYNQIAGYQTPSNVTGSNGTGVTLDGASSQIDSSQSVSNPTVYSEELWFNTTTTRGGKLIGFGDNQVGSSNNYDRHVWMLNSGQLEFGTYTGQTNTITSAGSYNDGNWHQLVATQGPAGMVLYVDGKSVGTNPTTGAQSYTGYWKVGGDVTWGGSDSWYFAGAVDEVAVYSSALTAAQVLTHYKASNINIAPTASFTTACNGLTCTFDASASADADGTVVGYAWNFGDGSTGSGVTASHTYAAAGSVSPSLVVTDDGGATATTARTINIKAAPADAYGKSVLVDGPALFWRLDETGGSTATDASVNNANGMYSGGVGYRTPGATSGGYGVTVDGSSGLISSQQPTTGPSVFTEELWFNTTSTNGGKLMGFGDAQTGNSSNYDRHIWMDGDGTLHFGTWTGNANVVSSGPGYNDGKWHQVAGSIGANGMVLYVDGAQVDTNANTGSQPYTGYWRVGGDTSWGGNPYFAGSVDEAAVYPTVLSAARIAAHYANSGNINQPPTAAFTPSCTNLDCSFDGSASADPDGTIASYAWDFGDGSTGTGAKPAHSYAAAGTYPVTLTVTDNQGATSTANHSVTVTAPVPANQAPTAAFTPACTNLSCSFDGSASADPDGTIASYAWDFGDGSTGTGAKPAHSYAAAGTYPVMLTVTDNQGATGSVSHSVTVTVPVNQAPTAAFTPTCSNLSCSFDGSASADPDGTIASYAWDFGDGSTGTGAKPAHSYAAAGTYPVMLTVTDNQGATGTTSQPVTVTAPVNQPPTAAFTPTCSNLDCSFDGSASADPDGTIASYAWNFGDTVTATGVTASHSFTVAGSQTVTLTVTDNGGKTATVSKTFTVTAPSTTFVSDAFNRTVASGLGTADLGGAWTSIASAANLSVGSGVAKFNMATTTSAPGAYLGGVSSSDSDITVTMSSNKAGTGNGIYVYVIGRRTGTNNEYRARLRLLSTGAVAESITKLAGTATESLVTSEQTVPGLGTYTPGDQLNVRFVVTGTGTTSLKLKVWKVGTTEPVAFQQTASDTTASLQAPGAIGLSTYLSGSATNAPVLMSAMNLSAKHTN